MKKIDPIKFTSDENGITIFISSPLLEHVTNHHPDGITVTNLEVLQAKVAFELEYNLGSTESGLTGLQELLDKAIIKAAEWESGCEFEYLY